MTPEERAELDRLLDLAEKEKLLEAAPPDDLGTAAVAEDVIRERLVAAVALQEQAEAERQHREMIKAHPATKELKWGEPDTDEQFD